MKLEGPQQLQERLIEPLRLGAVTINSRLIVGTGKYSTYEIMAAALEACARRIE